MQSREVLAGGLTTDFPRPTGMAPTNSRCEKISHASLFTPWSVSATSRRPEERLQRGRPDGRRISRTKTLLCPLLIGHGDCARRGLDGVTRLAGMHLRKLCAEEQNA